MTSITVKYTEWLTGEEKEITHYFHVGKKNVLKLDADLPDGLENTLKNLKSSIDMLNSDKLSPEEKATVERSTKKEAYSFFEKVLNYGYGKLSADGTRFMQSEELSADFMASPEYDEVYMKLISDVEEARKFLDKAFPSAEELTKYVNEK